MELDWQGLSTGIWRGQTSSHSIRFEDRFMKFGKQNYYNIQWLTEHAGRWKKREGPTGSKFPLA